MLEGTEPTKSPEPAANMMTPGGKRRQCSSVAAASAVAQERVSTNNNSTDEASRRNTLDTSKRKRTISGFQRVLGEGSKGNNSHVNNSNVKKASTSGEQGGRAGTVALLEARKAAALLRRKHAQRKLGLVREEARAAKAESSVASLRLKEAEALEAATKCEVVKARATAMNTAKILAGLETSLAWAEEARKGAHARKAAAETELQLQLHLASGAINRQDERKGVMPSQGIGKELRQQLESTRQYDKAAAKVKAAEKNFVLAKDKSNAAVVDQAGAEADAVTARVLAMQAASEAHIVQARASEVVARQRVAEREAKRAHFGAWSAAKAAAEEAARY